MANVVATRGKIHEQGESEKTLCGRRFQDVGWVNTTSRVTCLDCLRIKRRNESI